MNILEQLTKISLGKKIALLGLAVIAVAIVYWFSFYGALADELSNLEAAYSTAQREKQSALEAKATYDGDRRRLETLKQGLLQQIRELPTDSQMSSFLDNLNTQAELVGLGLQSVKPLNEAPTENYVRIPVQLKLVGTFHQLAKFFYLVGNLDRIINIENISLQIGKAAPGVLNENRTMLAVEVLATTFRALRVDEGSAPAGQKKR